ncbi:MAG: 2,3,4,5-tetrahydropyridine-2,6-dicarboxylate N-succinyltransferase [Candidatus Eremiobacteraeota bacterium]|nr:2,3,4,5-tetrahydropyridine-2,6-dicarboxylate N-succinyltransferase [Candidatus Eremiobacteraeota bacterium]
MQALDRSSDGGRLSSPSVVRGAQGKVLDEIVAALDVGALRACEPRDGGWSTNAWVKRAILLYFARHETAEIGAYGIYRGSETRADGPAAERNGFDQLESLGELAAALRYPPSYYDKIPTKRNYAQLGARCVPPGVARYGSFLGRGTILMPAYVNIGAYVDEGSMIDTWATVGSCAQIGKNVHLSGGVGIGGVLEPPQAQPVIVEDGAFIGSRCVIVEGVHVGREAVLGAGVVLTASTPIVDVRGHKALVAKGCVAPRSVVIPGTMPKAFSAGSYGVPCALVIGERSASTDRKTSLEASIREYGVAV